MSLTLGQIQDAIRRRLGWPSADTFVSDAELADMIRFSRAELVDLLISIHQGDYRLIAGAFQTVADQALYVISPTDPALSSGSTPDLLVDFSRIRKVALILNDRTYPMRRWDVETVNDRTDSVAWDTSTDIRYRISHGLYGDSEKLLYFTPTPAGAYIVQVWGNAGTSAQTFSETDTINSIGNDEYLILDGMIKCLQMEESDTSLVERQKARYIEMLQSNGPPIDAGQAQTIQDVRGRDDDLDWSRRWW